MPLFPHRRRYPPRRGSGATVSSARFATVVGRLTGVNALVYLFAVVTSPILARTLGPSGRGDLAAIFVVLALAPTLADVGLYAYVARERARGVRRLGCILGSAVPIGLAASLVGVLVAVPLAHALGRGRHSVVLFVELGLFSLPISVFLQTLYGVAVGAERWGTVIASKFLSSGCAAVLIVGLSIVGRLTVTTAAISYLVTGLLANLPFLGVLRGSRPWRFSARVAREGLAFGSRSWLSLVASQGNARLDQLLMAAMVSSRQLGLYALAVTLASASGALITAVSNALLPRVAAGDAALAARACRITILFVGAYGLGVAIASPWVIPLVFGASFNDAIPMLVVLLAANMFVVPGQVLGAAVIAAGDPGASARSQLLGLAVTVSGLVLVLPLLGGVGAAWVSLASYAVSFVVVFLAALRRFGLRPSRFVVVSTADLRWLRMRCRRNQAETLDAAASM